MTNVEGEKIKYWHRQNFRLDPAGWLKRNDTGLDGNHGQQLQ
jgi:hypothetical protein